MKKALYSPPFSTISSFEMEGFITQSTSDWEDGGTFSFNGEEDFLPTLGDSQSVMDNSSKA